MKPYGGAGLRPALASRVLVADAAMATMLQVSDAAPDDFRGYEGDGGCAQCSSRAFCCAGAG